MSESGIISPGLLSKLTLSNFYPRMMKGLRILESLTELDQIEMDKIDVDLAATGVAFRERHNMPVITEAIGCGQPGHLRSQFRERLIAHRLASVNLSHLSYEPKLE